MNKTLLFFCFITYAFYINLLASAELSLDKILNNQVSVKKDLTLTIEEKNYLKNKKTITMCVHPNAFPYEAIKDLKHVGIAAWYMKELEKVVQVKFLLVPTKTWSDSLSYAKKRQCDIISLSMQTPLRKKYMNFTSPYIETSLVLITRKNTSFITNLNFLEGKNIAIVKNCAMAELLRVKYKYINFVDVDNLKNAFDLVAKEKYFGVISSNMGATYYLERYYSSQLQVSGKFDELWKLSIGVRNDDLLLLSILNKAIVLNTTFVEKILKEWFPLELHEVLDYGLVLKIVLFFSLVILLMFYKQRKLNTAKLQIKSLNDLLEEKVKNRTELLETINIKLENKSLELKNLNKNLDLRIKEEIKKRKKQDEILIEHSKLAAMGELLSMIAHQWKQPLSVLSILIQKLDLLNSKEKLTKTFIETQVKKASTLIQEMSNTTDDFKDLLKNDKIKEYFLFKKMVKKRVSFVMDDLKIHDIQIKLDIEEKIGMFGYERELSQVIINLISNSKDALLLNKIREPFILIKAKVKDERIKISIFDNAQGIKEDILNKIFDPYFTTKDSYNGTGLGLYMSKIIIERMDGSLSAKNYKKGVVFTILLPFS